MKLFYGTGNQSKLRNMRAILAGMPIELVTPADLGIRLPAVEETGATPLENAALKAEAYHAVSGLPSFSLDSGLYLEGVPAELQPGPYVRRVKGRELSDEEFEALELALSGMVVHGNRTDEDIERLGSVRAR